MHYTLLTASKQPTHIASILSIKTVDMVSVIIDMACSSSMQLNIYERNLVLRHTEGIMQFTMSLLLMTAI
jgi:hypothetical protein